MNIKFNIFALMKKSINCELIEKEEIKNTASNDKLNIPYTKLIECPIAYLLFNNFAISSAW